tara:strand:- start:6760 stop:6984 length:225 start_codon:yes stop_codon:yes gene_type:complete
MQNPIPLNTEDLIATLVKIYPDRRIKSNESYEEHLRYSGAVDVVEFLQEWFEATNKNTRKRHVWRSETTEDRNP